MNICGKIKSIESYGYELYLSIITKIGSIGELYGYYVNTEQYVENVNDLKRFKLEDEICFTPFIEWVTKYELIEKNEQPKFTQPIKKSSHIEVIGEIKSIIDDYTIIFDIGYLHNIEVIFEKKITNLKKGDKLKFGGNLSLNIKDNYILDTEQNYTND